MLRISDSLEKGIEDFRSWLESETATILQPLNGQGMKLIGKIREKLEDARTTCEKLEREGIKQVEKGKIIRKAKVTQKLSRYFLKQMSKVVFPSQTSFSEIDTFRQSLEKTVSLIEREKNIWFPRISPLFIIARKKVDFALNRLASSISELGAFLSTDYSKARIVENLLSGADDLQRLTKKLRQQEKEKSKIREEVELFQKNLEEIKQDMESVRGSLELSSLAEIDFRLEQLRKKAKHSFRHLRKPFSKFVNMVRGPGYSLSAEESEQLSHYLVDPFLALASEKPSLPTLKNILTKIKTAMEESKLKLKSSRMKTGGERINEILNDNALDELYRDCVRTLSLHKELTSSKKTQTAQIESKQLQGRATELRNRVETLEAQLKSIEGLCKELHSEINHKKTQLEETTHNILKKTVRIKLQ